jgi:hypothetical protein
MKAMRPESWQTGFQSGISSSSERGADAPRGGEDIAAYINTLARSSESSALCLGGGAATGRASRVRGEKTRGAAGALTDRALSFPAVA